jgi:hypothetical protein
MKNKEQPLIPASMSLVPSGAKIWLAIIGSTCSSFVKWYTLDLAGVPQTGKWFAMTAAVIVSHI